MHLLTPAQMACHPPPQDQGVAPRWVEGRSILAAPLARRLGEAGWVPEVSAAAQRDPATSPPWRRRDLAASAWRPGPAPAWPLGWRHTWRRGPTCCRGRDRTRARRGRPPRSSPSRTSRRRPRGRGALKEEARRPEPGPLDLSRLSKSQGRFIRTEACWPPGRRARSAGTLLGSPRLSAKPAVALARLHPQGRAGAWQPRGGARNCRLGVPRRRGPSLRPQSLRTPLSRDPAR